MTRRRPRRIAPWGGCGLHLVAGDPVGMPRDSPERMREISERIAAGPPARPA